MKILLIGAGGTIGTAVAARLEVRHEIVRASRSGAATTVPVDLTDARSIDALFAQIGTIDAIVCCAASAPLCPLDYLTEDFIREGMQAKLLGQIALVRHGLTALRDGGSITLTSGRFDTPLKGSALGRAVNEGLEGFVKGAAPDLPRGLRVNAVSPGWVRETLQQLKLDPTPGIPAQVVAQAYVDAVECSINGMILSPGR
ncbi:short chain dehydrogenase [Paraburkholderia sp.]|uniref:short chain dehydrogenase n=1 Tax=Paraburkholderia sp. TaxID=1926495 RepID=UPI003D6FA840